MISTFCARLAADEVAVVSGVVSGEADVDEY